MILTDAREIQEFKPKLQRQEQELFNGFMRDCKRAALILPKHECDHFAGKLIDQGHKHVFVGSQVYTGVTEVFNFYGYVPICLRRRIMGMEMAGIWKWWNKMIGNRYKNKNERIVSFEKPTMAGNVQVIFAVLLIGISLAILSLLMEIIRKLFIVGVRLNLRLFLELAARVLTEAEEIWNAAS